MNLHLDFETYSEADLKKVGCWAYASHPSTDILCMGVALGDEPVEVLRPADITSYAITAPTILERALLTAHNVQFEYAIAFFVLHRKYGWPAMTDQPCAFSEFHSCKDGDYKGRGE